MCYNPYVVDSRPAFVTDMDDARAGGPPAMETLQNQNQKMLYKTTNQKFYAKTPWENNIKYSANHIKLMFQYSGACGKQMILT
jgi:hypothetical protein